MKTLFFIFTFLCFPHLIFAQNSNGIIKGIIIDKETQSPVAGAIVEIINSEFKTESNESGEFIFTNLDFKNYEIKISSIGYNTLKKSDLIIYSSKPLEISFELLPSNLTTEEIEVGANYFEKNSNVNISSMNLDYEEVRRAPGAAEDIGRMLQTAPGVSIGNDQRNDLIVRGGSPSENLILIDGIEVPNINHFGSQGSSGGPIGIINLKFLQSADIYTGGFSSVFGDKLSSVVDIKFRNGSKNNFYSNVDLSMQGFGGIFEGPLTSKGSYMLSIRRSYLDLLKDAIRLSAVPNYWDMNLKLNYELNKNNYISMIGFSGIDKIEFEKRDLTDPESNPFENAFFNKESYTAGISHKYLFDKGYIQNIVSGTFSDNRLQQKDKLNEITEFKNNSKEREITIKSDLNYQLSGSFYLSTGLGYKNINSKNEIFDIQDTTATGYIIPELNVNNEINSYKLFGYVNVTNKFFKDKLSINYGVRADYFEVINNKTTISPRVGLSYKILPNTSLNAAFGVFHQTPEYVWLSTDEFNKNLNSIRADHYIAGIEHFVTPELRTTLEFYVKDYKDVPVSLDNPTFIILNGGTEYGPNLISKAISGGKGIVRGFDFSLHKKLTGDGFYGMLNYSYMKSEFTALAGGTVPSAFDQTHQLTLIAGYQVADDWLISAKFKFATGKPFTPYDIETSKSLGRGVYVMDRYNSERMPDYNRLDLRVDKKFNFKGFSIVGYVEVQNVFNKQNISEYYWDTDFERVGKIYHWSFFPVGGFSLQF
ncbi:MAG TPA: hypothetical protein DEP28_11390 [Bacteroidetes bacterium]|nr:carboxypeptidase-like regulatory domain-containing protein [Ignavibacteria bacterium]HCA43842.1 hypothetical protein [Bacteroidota bacterium]